MGGAATGWGVAPDKPRPDRVAGPAGLGKGVTVAKARLGRFTVGGVGPSESEPTGSSPTPVEAQGVAERDIHAPDGRKCKTRRVNRPSKDDARQKKCELTP